MKLAIKGGKKSVTFPHPHFSWPLIEKEEIKAVTTYLQSRKPISIDGREGIYKELEDTIKKYFGVRYALLTNSGTTALHSAFFGVGIKPGDEVIAPTYTFLATVTPIFHCGGIPILCDAQTDTGNVDPKDIEERVTKKTKAIVVTHMLGHPVELDEICQIARRHKLFLIEDCSHAHGALYKEKKVGTFGDAACFSLQAQKIITAGEGGFLITNDREIYERAILLGHFRERCRQEVKLPFYKQFVDTGYGLKYRIHPLGAVIALVQFKKLDKWIKLRRETLNYFSKKLEGIPGIEPPETRTYVDRGAWYGYKPKYKPEELDNLPVQKYIKALQAEGVEIHKPGSKPLHLLPLFQIENDRMYGFTKKTYKRGDFPKAEKYYESILSLPTFTLPPERDIIDQYIEAFQKVANNIKELV